MCRRKERHLLEKSGKKRWQYEDYMDMCQKLKKDTSDEMVFRPSQLRRRHDEAVAEIKEREAEITADEYSKRYPDAEKVLKAVAGKLEYHNDRYIIIVPERNIDIVKEGRELHHCAGSSDRYFDRIAQNETYICFLRRAEEPDKPYYTIEVEPGGTIRQHRGMYDEEPEIEEVKPFLREWQGEIRKRMSREDHELAAASKQKREENIRELSVMGDTSEMWKPPFPPGWNPYVNQLDPRVGRIEEICQAVVGELRKQGLTDSRDAFLEAHTWEIMKRIQDSELKKCHVMEG